MVQQEVFRTDQPWTPEKLRACRLRLDKTTEELAQLLDVTPATYEHWECGTATPAHPAMLRLALKCLLVVQTMEECARAYGPQMNAQQAEIDAMLAESRRMDRARQQAPYPFELSTEFLEAKALFSRNL